MSERSDHHTHPAKKTSFISNVKELAKFIIIAILIVAPIRFFVASPFIVSGSSMYPTFKNGQYLIVEEISYRLHPPERGDVIVFKYPKDPSKYYIKRIIGLPGETVLIRDGDVIIKNDDHPQGVKIREEYILNESPSFFSDTFRTTLGSEEYFVLGDNRPSSSDSRIWGAVPQKLIIGRTYVRLFPLNSVDLRPGADTDVLYPKLQIEAPGE